jgi:metal-responsive CopG/Arc/MetJ family transcriptional regulator
MRVKTSVTLPSSLLEEIDRLNSNRSAFLEEAALAYLAQNAKKSREAKDAAIIDKHANRLNREAADVLEYQTLPE